MMHHDHLVWEYATEVHEEWDYEWEKTIPLCTLQQQEKVANNWGLVWEEHGANRDCAGVRDDVMGGSEYSETFVAKKES